MTKIEDIYFSMPKRFQTVTDKKFNTEGTDAWLDAIQVYITSLEDKYDNLHSEFLILDKSGSRIQYTNHHLGANNMEVESVYAVAATEEIAEAIIEKDEQDGQIEEGAYTVKMIVHEKMTTV
jgi:hypothetical protein